MLDLKTYLLDKIIKLPGGGYMDFRKKLSQKVALGTFMKITDPAVAEIAGYAGLDFVIIDLEHGPGNIQTAQNLIRAAERSDITPVIRVAKNDEKHILRALDIGAHGVQVPGINNREQAEKLVKNSYYEPKGSRGVCRYVRAAEYTNIEKSEFFARSNEDVFTVAHIEGEEGINNLDEILEVQELDVLFIGPYDLSQSMGIPGEINSPQLIEKMEEVVEKCLARDKIVGAFAEETELAKKWMEAGVNYLAYSVDVGLISEKFASLKENLLRGL